MTFDDPGIRSPTVVQRPRHGNLPALAHAPLLVVRLAGAMTSWSTVADSKETMCEGAPTGGPFFITERDYGSALRRFPGARWSCRTWRRRSESNRRMATNCSWRTSARLARADRSRAFDQREM